jgi:pimeloyl-ACP methyl ester carboxylesterase
MRVFYEVYGDGTPTIVFMTPMICHSRLWKGQIPFLARHFRVIAIDPRGNGRSDHPATPAQCSDSELQADALAVMDATGTDRAVFVGICTSSRWEAVIAADHPDRVLGLVAIGPNLALAPDYPSEYDFDAVLDTDEGWAKENRHYWLRDWAGFNQFWFSHMFPEPHSTKQVEDAVVWALDTTPESMLHRVDAPMIAVTLEEAEDVCRRIRCPVLVIAGDLDRCQPPARAVRFAELTRGEFRSK